MRPAVKLEPPSGRQVDLWCVPLPFPERIEAGIKGLLSAAEIERGARFVWDPPRRAYWASRGALRLILASYLGCSARDIGFATSEFGKPELMGRPGLFFNLSHTEGLALIVVATGMEVGVDVERLRVVDGAQRLAARYFDASERATWAGDSEGFLRLWTCRESAVKAAGTGISAGWDAVHLVQRSPEQTVAMGLGRPCQVRTWVPQAGYVAAVAALADPFDLRRSCTLTDLPDFHEEYS